MKIISACAASAMALLSTAGIQNANAAGKEYVLWAFTDVVLPAEQTAFEGAIESYNKCLGEQQFQAPVRAYGSETGNTYQYTFVIGLQNFAQRDAMSSVVQACSETFRSKGNAHLQSESSVILVVKPELSYMPATRERKPGVVSVTSYTLKNGAEGATAFTAGMTRVREAIQKSNSSGSYAVYEVRGGSTAAPQYVVVKAYKGWAEYGADGESTTWNMIEKGQGKAAADELRKSIAANVVKSTSHVDSYIAKLSYIPRSQGQ